MANTRSDQNRRLAEFHTGLVDELLPEFFESEYPKLTSFLEAYYDNIQSPTANAFANQIHDLYKIRNISSTDLAYLDNIIAEIGNGLQSSTFFQQPRLMARLLASFYRSKGSQISTEQFFKAFFGETVSIEYPKNNVFIVGESRLGADSMRFITDDKRYQIFSILIKTGLSKSDYESLYTKFAHPAGFFLASDVVAQSEAVIDIRAGLSIDPLAQPEGPTLVSSQASINIEPEFTSLTMTNDTNILTGSLETLARYSDVSISTLNTEFGTIGDVTSPNSPTMDDTEADFSYDFETMDASMFTTYLNDSSL